MGWAFLDFAALSISSDLRFVRARQFVTKGGTPLRLVALFDDLRLGYFEKGGRLVLGSYR